MKYISNFYSLSGDRYDLSIITNHSSGTTRQITLGVPPFVTEMDEDEENIYKSVKYQSATVSIIASGETDYMFDLYSGEANGTRVTLSKSGVTVWDGFATPVLYNNGYSEIHDNIQLECIDGLSILQYYKYNSDNKKVLPFIDIVNKILAKCEVYNNLYVSNNTKLTQSSTRPILNELYISEQNFFDEKKDNETDNDVAWTCQEVLEEICKYLGLVCVADGDSVYMLDYDAIKANKNTYYKYNIGSSAYTSATLTSTLPITQEMYRGAENTISLDNVYNKVSVKDDFYTFDSVIPNMYDNLQNITKSSDPALQSSENIGNGMFGEVVTGSDGNMEALVDRVWSPDADSWSDFHVVFCKYFKNDNYNFTCPSEINYTDTKTMEGCCIAKFFVKKLEHAAVNSWWALIFGGQIDYGTLDKWLEVNEVSNPTFQNYICFFNPNNKTNQSWLTTKSNDLTALFGGENAYLLIKGHYNFHYINEDPYPIAGGVDISEGRYAIKAGQTYLKCKLQWGNQYWNGSGWTQTNTTFNLPYLRSDSSSDERRSDSLMFKDKEFLNTVNWRIGTTKKGYAIPVPQGEVMEGLPQITIYSPFTPEYYSTKSGDDEGQWYKHSRVFLKDFDVQAIIGDPTFSDRNNTDTVYTNVIDDNHVQELDEVEFKICTNDNKNPNFSSVAYKSNNKFQFLNQTYNQAFATNLVQEEHYINRLCNQYKQPKIRLTLDLLNNVKPWAILTDKWLGQKKFIVSTQAIDYYNDKTNIVIVEKG